MADGETPPRLVRANANSNPRAPPDVVNRLPAIFDPYRPTRTPRQITPIVFERNAHGTRQVSGAAAQLMDRHVGLAAPPALASPLLHELDPRQGLERANQHGGRGPGLFGDRVDQIVHAVIQVDVGKPGRAIERLVPRRWPRGSMAGGIGLPDVGLGFDNEPARQTGTRSVDEHLAEQVSSYL
jgi:hypothetical protein